MLWLCGLQESVQHCTSSFAVAGAGGAWCSDVSDVSWTSSSLSTHRATVRSSQGISVIKCLLGVKQGCPLSLTFFGPYVDGCWRSISATAGNDAPHLFDVLVTLLLYADEPLLMFTSASGLQRQLDALQGFCELRQFTVHLAKTKWSSMQAKTKA